MPYLARRTFLRLVAVIAIGFVLRAVNPFAYPGLPDETQLLWYKRLVG